jgi:hypothetical protein
MERDDYERAVALMKAHPNLQDFAGPRTEELVQAAEQALALSVPDIYRRFLLEYGALRVRRGIRRYRLSIH